MFEIDCCSFSLCVAFVVIFVVHVYGCFSLSFCRCFLESTCLIVLETLLLLLLLPPLVLLPGPLLVFDLLLFFFLLSLAFLLLFCLSFLAHHHHHHHHHHLFLLLQFLGCFGLGVVVYYWSLFWGRGGGFD